MNATKEKILRLLGEWIKQRPGLDPADYGLYPGCRMSERAEALRNYNSEMRRITGQLHDARRLLEYVASHDDITADDLTAAFRAFSGRLKLTKTEKGEWRLEYCTGQYFPTEYRAAACAVLASAIWDYHRPDYMNDDRPGDSIRKAMKRIFGLTIARRWFD